MTYNLEAFRYIDNIFDLHPEQHNQESYESYFNSCGTTRCVAGWAFVHKYQDEMLPGEGIGETRDRLEEELRKPGFLYSPGSSLYFDDIARDHLGLSLHQASVLFDAALENEDARRYVKAFAHGQVPIPEEDDRVW